MAFSWLRWRQFSRYVWNLSCLKDRFAQDIVSFPSSKASMPWIMFWLKQKPSNLFNKGSESPRADFDNRSRKLSLVSSIEFISKLTRGCCFLLASLKLWWFRKDISVNIWAEVKSLWLRTVVRNVVQRIEIPQFGRSIDEFIQFSCTNTRYFYTCLFSS